MYYTTLIHNFHFIFFLCYLPCAPQTTITTVAETTSASGATSEAAETTAVTETSIAGALENDATTEAPDVSLSLNCNGFPVKHALSQFIDSFHL